MEDWSRVKLCDVVNLLLGTILFFSPWLFSLPAGAPRQIASIMGLFVAVLSIAALAAFAVWEEWLNLIAGRLRSTICRDVTLIASTHYSAVSVRDMVSMVTPR